MCCGGLWDESHVPPTERGAGEDVDLEVRCSDGDPFRFEKHSAATCS